VQDGVAGTQVADDILEKKKQTAMARMTAASRTDVIHHSVAVAGEIQEARATPSAARTFAPDRAHPIDQAQHSIGYPPAQVIGGGSRAQPPVTSQYSPESHRAARSCGLHVHYRDQDNGGINKR